jgi:hypothetical protein
MNVDWSFPKYVAIALVGMGCLSVYPLMTYGSRDIIIAVVAGTLVTTANVLLGYAAVEYSWGKSTTTFFKYVVGGMGLRMFMMAIVLVLFIKVFQFHTTALVGSMGVSYVVFLTLEILFIQKKISIKHQN